MSYADLLHGIQASIKVELSDAEFYTKLSEIAPNEEMKNVLLDLAKEEKDNAKLLKDAYYRLTGRMPAWVEINTYNIGDFKKEIRQKAFDEIRERKRYREHYISCRLDWLRDILFEIIESKGEHAVKLLFLINGDEKSDIEG